MLNPTEIECQFINNEVHYFIKEMYKKYTLEDLHVFLKKHSHQTLVFHLDNNKTELWYFKEKLHRVDGPAVTLIGENGNHIYWYKNGLIHREDGPAILFLCSNVATNHQFYLNDRNMPKEEWWNSLSKEEKLKALFNGFGND